MHRDIKPHNVLVDSDGQVKLLDFGIAKVLREHDWSSKVETATGRSPMTPTYASPEQLRAQPITAASDVYSLGVLLYQLLTGELPYAAKPESSLALVLAICESPVPRPSTRFGTNNAEASNEHRGIADARRSSVSGLHRRLRGDLDLITLMALRKDPDRRYRDARCMGEDLQRHLTHFPVKARQDSRVYRASRFIARHKLAVRVTLLGIALSAGLGVWSLWLASANREQSKEIVADRDHFYPWSPGALLATRRNLGGCRG